MKVLRSIILCLPLLLFSIENSDHEKIEEFYTLIELEKIESYKDQNSSDYNTWLLKELIEGHLVNKLRAQIKEGNLTECKELEKTIDNLEVEIEKFAQKISHNKGRKSKQDNQLFIKTVACSCKIEIEDEYTEEEIREQIEALREQEQIKKDEALELALQAGSEIIAAGGWASAGAEYFAIYDGAQAVRHIIKSCEQYNEGVEAGQYADQLEEEYFSEEETDDYDLEEENSKSWWEFWK